MSLHHSVIRQLFVMASNRVTYQSHPFMSLRAKRGNLIKKEQYSLCAKRAINRRLVFRGKYGKALADCQHLEKKKETRGKFSLRELTE